MANPDFKHVRGIDVGILTFQVSDADFQAMNRIDLTTLPTEEFDALSERHIRLYGDGKPHDYDYISGPIGMEHENYFHRRVSHLLNFMDS